jgi:hypothetical protein
MSDLGRSPASYRGLVAHWRQHATSTPNRDLQKPLVSKPGPYICPARRTATPATTPRDLITKFAPEPMLVAENPSEWSSR